MKKSLLRFINNYRFELTLVAVVIAAIFVRYYNYNNRMVFDSEQARSLIISGNNLKDKFSLLGQEYFRTTSTGHKLFSGALFSYSLVPLQVLFNFDAYKITIYFGLLNIFTGVLLYHLSSKIFNKKIALISTILFLFSDMMIKHSMFIWILNYVPLLGVSVTYLVAKYFKDRKLVYPVLLGLLMGVGINLHYPIIVFTGIVGLMIAIKSKFNVSHLAVYLFGLLLGNWPTIIFDLRHNWYHLRMFYQYVLDTFAGNGQNISYYYLFLLWPILCIAVAWIITKIARSNFLIVVLLLLYLDINLTSKWVSFKGANEMPDNLRYSDIMKTAEIIAKDKPENFNVSTLFGFDARGFILRYPLEFNYGYKPQSVEEYKNISSLYVMALNDEDIKNPSRYELQSFLPYNYIKLDNINDSYQIYKLTKK